MTTKETKTDGKYNINMGWILFLPIILLLGVVPLITRLAVVTTDIDTYKVFGQKQVFDFFSQNKSALIIGIALTMILALFLAYDKRKMKLDKTMKGYYLLTGAYVLFSVISTLMSDYKSIAMWGIADRAEGMIVLGAYIIIMLYTIYMINQGTEFKYIIAPLCVLVIISTVIGFFQYFGNDILLKTELGQNLIIPAKYAEVKGSLTSEYESGRIYGTMYHYNYMGSFAAMMVPFFLTLTLFMRGTKFKVVCGVMTLMSTFLLLGSTSRAGLIGLGCSILVFIIIFAKKIIKGYKFTLPVILAAMLVVVGLGVATKGEIFSRLPALVNDAIGIFLPSDKSFDYRDHIPVREIRTEGNTLIFQMQGDSLTIMPTEEGLAFQDQEGNPVDFVKGEKYYTTTDERFSAIGVDRQSAGEETIRDFILTTYNDKGLVIAEINTPEGAYIVNKNTLEKEPLETPEIIGFQGKERLGSARGYIWSRSLPMMKDTLLIGKGPDTYALEFPQGDIFGKWYAYESPTMIVDKPHNLYLQIGIGQGGIALLAFLGMMLLYIFQSFKLYVFKGNYENIEVAGVALLVAVVGYLGAGIFNDSIVSVAPIFWILLGAGIAINFLVIKERKRMQALLEHATIDMQTRKHV